jgi:S1-C subfamily serine protease
MIDDFNVGDRVQLTIMRDGKTRETDVILQPGA